MNSYPKLEVSILSVHISVSIYMTLILFRRASSTAVWETKIAVSCPPWVASTEGARLLDAVKLVDLLVGEVNELEVLDDALGRDGLGQDCRKKSVSV